MPTSKPARTPVSATRTVTVPGPEDLELAKEDALLQLRIGRSAHLYTIGVSAVLALDAVLLLFFFPDLPKLASGTTGFVALGESFYLFLPILAGVAIASIGLASKWEAFQLWPWEAHFSTTVGALGVNALTLVVYLLRIAGVAPFATLAVYPLLYPVALTGISLALIGIVLTWTGWSARQWASAVSAVLPIATTGFLFVHPRGTAGDSAALGVGLLLSAFFYQTSGSLLHLLTSGTRAHERELITSGQSKMFRLSDDLSQKEEALQFREATLVKREADAENAEESIRRQTDALKEARQQVEDLEADYRGRSDALLAKEREWAGRRAEFDGRVRQADDREKAIALREEEVERQMPILSDREKRLVDQEGAQTARDVELTQRSQELDRRAQAVPDGEARLETRRKEIDAKLAEVLKREGEVAARENRAIAGSAPAAATALAERETKLRQLKAVLDEQNASLGSKSREVADRAKAADDALAQVRDREATLARREATLRQGEAALADQQKTVADRRTRYDTAAKEYEGRSSDLSRREADLAAQATNLDRSLKTLRDLELKSTDRERRLKSASDDLTRREQTLRARERSVESSEAELGLRRQERLRAGDVSMAGLAAVAMVDHLDAPPPSRAAARGRPGSSPSAAPAPPEDLLTPPPGRRFPDRLPTGTPRLDDLLLGGLPARAHVAVVGDAFVGKEVVVFSFVAEGLKRGEPAVLVTATRSPAEVAQSLGVVVPQFREYEQMGLVVWIDASGSNGPSDATHRRVKGSDDRAGILSHLAQVAKGYEAPKSVPFRVAFLGLSAVLGHGDDRAGFAFLQNVVGILKPRDALAMYTLEGGALGDAQVESLLGRMDGAIVFRQDRDRTFLSVRGLGEVETHDWIECRTTNRTLTIGSFALERIR